MGVCVCVFVCLSGCLFESVRFVSGSVCLFV